MRSFGVLLLLLGIGTFVLDAFDRQFAVLAWAEDYQPWVSIGLAVLGLILVIATMMRSRDSEAAS